MDKIWIIIVVIVFALVFLPKIGKITQYVSTLFHEVGHVVGSFVTGGGASSIKLHKDTSGVAGTTHRVGAGGFVSRTFTVLSGYATPVNLGAILVGLSFTEWVNVGIGIICLFSIIAFLLIRNLFGLLVTVSFLGLLAFLVFIPTPLTFSNIVLFFGALVFLNGVKDVYQIAPYTFKKTIDENNLSDFHILATDSIFPAKVWFVIFIIGEMIFFTSVVMLLISLPIT